MDFQTFHRYNKLVARGLTKPLTCPTCGEVYTLRLSVDNDPVLQCFTCDALVQPGWTLYENISAVVKEHLG